MTRTDTAAPPDEPKAAAKPRAARAGKAHILPARFADPDLVDRIFDYVVELLPEIAAHQAEVKLAVRAEFAGQQVSVRSRDWDLARQVLAAFNGRNATEVARMLRISRATVYRLLKQPGRR